MFIGVPTLLLVVRWYLKRATPAYQRESAAYAVLNGTITESVEGARTVDALRLGRRRMARVDADLREAFEAEKVTLRLRTILFPGIDAAFVLAPAAVLLWGGYLASEGYVTVGAVTTIVLYTYQITGPVWELIFWVDEIQVAATSLARIVGVQLVEPDRTAREGTPVDEDIAARGLTYAYREGHNVLHGIDLDLAAGERLAVVGPSGAGKSTLGRMLAGIHPPTDGTVTVGGVPLIDLPLEELRGHVALVTQEHHVFVGSVADNLRLAQVDADAARARARAAGGRRLGVGAGAARGAGHRGRLGRCRADAGAGAADRAGSAGPARPAHAGARRGHLAARPAGGPAPRAVAVGRALGPDRRRDRPPPAHRARRGPGGGGRRRPDHRDRPARRAGRRRRRLRGAVALLAARLT